MTAIRSAIRPAIRGAAYSPASNPFGGGGAPPIDPLTLSPVWLGDFADTDTMYLTSAGATEVSEDGDTVGTLLEVSEWANAALDAVVSAQSEIVASDWLTGSTSVNGATLSQVDGALRVTSNSPAYGAAQIKINAVVSGAFYRLGLGVASAFATSVQLAGTTVLPTAVRSGVFGAIAKTSSTTIALVTLINSSIGNYADFSNPTLKLIPGAHSHQATANSRPKWYSTNIVRFDALDDALRLGIKPTAAGSFVLKTRPTTASRIVIGCQNATPDRCYLGIDASGQLAGGIGSDAMATIHGDTDIRNTTGVAALTWGADGVKLYWNKALVYSGAINGSLPTGVALSLGALNANGTDSSFWGGDIIGEPAIFDSQLTAAQVEGITNYLNT